MKKPSLTASISGCRGRRPLHLWLLVLPPQNRFALCGLYVVQEDSKAVQILLLRYYFYLIFDFYMLFFIKSAPSRLAPNEGLVHTPLGALPLDPTSPLAPGLTLRFIARFARYWLPTLCGAIIPHSSLLTPHFNPSPPRKKNFPLDYYPKKCYTNDKQNCTKF